MALDPGTRLGPYEIAGALGAGGMGEVYRASDTRLGRTVAIKVLPAHVASDPVRRERFEREARSVAALSHPNICTAHDVGRERPAARESRSGPAAEAAGAVDSGQPVDFLVMEFLDGETLAQRLERGALPLVEALRIAGEIAEALDAAHRRGIVHRDLKPGNVMLTATGVKLLDFGLARPHEAGSPEDAFESTPIPGTEGTAGVAFSPDGQQVALHLQNDGRWTLNRIPLAGGSPFTIIDGDGDLNSRFAWLPDNTIVYSVVDGDGGGGLMQVPASGGRPRALTQPDDQYTDVWPLAVPGRGEIFFTSLNLASRQLMEDGSNLAVYSPETAGTQVLIEDAVGLGYLEPGFLLYGDRNSLMGVGVDLDTLGVTGVPTPLFFDRAGEEVGTSAMSQTGTLVYVVRPDDSAGEDGAVPTRIHVVVNWFGELRLLLLAS